MKECRVLDGTYEARIELLPQSVIYSVHFPGMPVTPGACLVQIACELASVAAGAKLELSSASDIRFLSPVLPSECKEILASLSGETPQEEPSLWEVKMFEGETLCARMKLFLKRA